jgi:tetratricopeptide (TPR) repeat protein
VSNQKGRAAIVVFFFILSVSLQANPANYQLAYEELRDAMYDYRPLPQVEAVFQSAVSMVEEENLGERQRLYWLSRLEYVMGRAYQSREDKKRAAPHFEAGLDYAQRAVELEEFSDGWRMMAENIGQLLLVRGTSFLLSNWTKGPQYAQRALKTDPENVPARIYLAAAKVYPPAIAGGDPAKGIEMLTQTLALQSGEKDDLFNIYSGLGICYGKLRRKAEASEWLLKALELYPNNAFARKELTKVGGSADSTSPVAESENGAAQQRKGR